jgi:hypothetical protein
MLNRLMIVCIVVFSIGTCFAQTNGNLNLQDKFRNPPFEYRPFFPFQGAGSSNYQTTENIQEQLDKIYNIYGYGGIIVSPADDKPFKVNQKNQPSYLRHIGNGLQVTRPAGSSPWLMTLPLGVKPYKSEARKDQDFSKLRPLPAYLSKEYFNQLKNILATSKKHERKVIFYDEVGYPSGIANHTTPEQYYRKLLVKEEEPIAGPIEIQKDITGKGVLMAIVAMNSSTLDRINLTPLVTKNALRWNAPSGDWKLMFFYCVTATPHGGELDYRSAIDYMDPEAVNWFVDKVYEPHAREVGEYFGTTLFQTFFDDVGIFDEERTWTTKFNEKFKARTGLNPEIYYPALWENIGPETEAARIAFFDTRAELLADGFPKIVTDWGMKNNIEVSGHAPGNYDPQPVDMNGDPFKFYRAQPIPMVDVIFSYPTGRDGFKLVSDGADFYDKPIVAAETFSSFSPPGKKAGYRRLMELYIRGVNRFMGSGLPSLDVPEEKTTFANWVGRSSMMLQGGKRIADIAIYYPIADLEAFYHFDAVEYTKDMRWGTFVPYDNDFMAVGEMLLGEVHRDFTFVHPDFLLSDKIRINGKTLELENKVNNQTYNVLIIPGQKVISLKALEKIKAYYDQGGIVLATSLLPSIASELTGNEKENLSNNQRVQAIVKEIFGIDPTRTMPEGVSAIKTNKMKGKAVFIRKPDGKLLSKIIDKLKVSKDVIFEGEPSPMSGGGMFSYIHKNKENRDIYFFANSSDDEVETITLVRGKIIPELWNPTTGEVKQIKETEYVKKDGQDYTRFPILLKAVTSTFVVSAN